MRAAAVALGWPSGAPIRGIRARTRSSRARGVGSRDRDARRQINGAEGRGNAGLVEQILERTSTVDVHHGLRRGVGAPVQRTERVGVRGDVQWTTRDAVDLRYGADDLEEGDIARGAAEFVPAAHTPPPDDEIRGGELLENFGEIVWRNLGLPGQGESRHKLVGREREPRHSAQGIFGGL